MAAVVMFVDGAAGADTNGGSSAAVIVSGSDGDTNGTSTVDLSGDTPDLSGVSIGDLIRLSAETTGRGNEDLDIHEITAVDDGADTVTVTPTPGTSTGQTWVIGGAYATIQKAMGVALSLDKTWIKASATYNESPDLKTAGGDDIPIVYEGYTSSTGDGGQITVTGTLTDTVGGRVNNVFKNWIIDGGSSRTNCVSFGSSNNTFRNCIFKDATAVGVVCTTSQIFLDCHFLDQGSDGCTCGAGTAFINCKVYRNAAKGLTSSGSIICYNCVFFSNGDEAINTAPTTAQISAVFNCTIDGDGDDTLVGIKKGSATRGPIVIINNIVYDCTTGIEEYSGDRSVILNTLVNANGTTYAGNAASQGGEVTDPPDFVNEVSGVDYSLNEASPAVGAANDFSSDNGDLGALQLAASAGGGLLMANKRGGKQ